jgi:hypothetical protein
MRTIHRPDWLNSKSNLIWFTTAYCNREKFCGLLKFCGLRSDLIRKINMRQIYFLSFSLGRPTKWKHVKYIFLRKKTASPQKNTTKFFRVTVLSHSSHVQCSALSASSAYQSNTQWCTISLPEVTRWPYTFKGGSPSYISNFRTDTTIPSNTGVC